MTPASQKRQPLPPRGCLYYPGILLVLACVGGLIAPFLQWHHLYPPDGSPWPMMLPDASPETPMAPGSNDYHLVGVPMLVVIGTCLFATVLALLMPRRLRRPVRTVACVIAILTSVLLCPLSFLASLPYPGAWVVSRDAGSILAGIRFPAIPILGICWLAIANDTERLLAPGADST